MHHLRFLSCTVCMVLCFKLSAQTVIGGDTIDQSAILDIQDTTKGVMLPRLTTTQRNAILKPAFGLLILNTTRKCLEANIGSPLLPDWKCLTTGIPNISDADTLYWNRKLSAGDTLGLSDRINTKLTAADTAALSNRIDAKIGLPPTGNNLGNMLYWDGTAWVRLSPGLPGQIMSLSQDGLPIWTGAALATISTNSLTSISLTSVIVGGQVSADGGANVSARGIVWSTTANPTLSSNVLALGNGTGNFSETLSGLSPNTKYYIRAYATNSAGTAYGTQQSFTTLPAELPTLTTYEVSSITQTNAISGGNITNDGGAIVTQRGLVYGTTQNPTLSNAFTQDGSGMGNFTTTLSGLTPNTTYYIRSYATNSSGIAYGVERSFTTLDSLSVPDTTSSTTICGAYIAPNEWREFMCYNLGAAYTGNNAARLFTPSWELNGGYWQWGRKAMAAAGPSGPDTEQANVGGIAGWDETFAPNLSWGYQDNSGHVEKTGSDPCPAGFRVPTWNEWDGVIANNPAIDVNSTWTNAPANYSTGKKFGDKLFLPAAGFRRYFGTLSSRGVYGFYWSSLGDTYNEAWYLGFVFGKVDIINDFRTVGASLRCISE